MKNWDKIARVFIQVNVWLKIASANWKEGGNREGACLSRGTGCGSKRPQVEACSKYVREKRPHVEVREASHGMAVINYYVSGGYLTSLSMF
jgi:hypothetical protein